MEKLVTETVIENTITCVELNPCWTQQRLKKMIFL